MNDCRLVCIATFDDPSLAHVARLKLELEGIKAVLDGEHHVAMDWLMTNAIGGIKLLVADRNREDALRVMDTRAAESIDGVSDSLDKDSDCCPKCNSTAFYRQRSNSKLIFLSIMLLGFPLPLRLKSEWLTCDSCGYTGRYVSPQ